MRNTRTTNRVKITSLEQLRQLVSGEEDLDIVLLLNYGLLTRSKREGRMCLSPLQAERPLKTEEKKKTKAPRRHNCRRGIGVDERNGRR